LSNFEARIMNANIAISVEGLSKRFLLGRKKESSLAANVVSVFSKKQIQDETEHWALRDINFKIEQGDVVGIVGKNGAGKSTLLKILSQITRPTNGRIEIHGRVASLLEVGTGFHPELTGRENIYLNGTILGMTRKEVRNKFEEIVSFSGVEKFIDTPVKHYSSGMYVRLAFAVAAHLEPEILIIDEVLAVGDSEFQEKCLGKMRDVSSEGRTILFVSHNLAAVQALCRNGILLENGRLKEFNSVTHVLDVYSNLKKYSSNQYVSSRTLREDQDLGFAQIRVLNKNNDLCSEFTCNDEILIEFTFDISSLSRKYNVFVIVKDKYGSPVFSAERGIDRSRLTLCIKQKFLTRGRYSLQTFIHIPTVFQLEALDDICHFSVSDVSSSFAIHGDYNYGNVFGLCEWIEGEFLR